jgi:hypothetical protein
MNLRSWQSRWMRRSQALAVGAFVLIVSACQQKMAHQPYYRVQEETDFFEDGRSARPLEAGTISYRQLLPDNPLLTGLTPEGRIAKAKLPTSPEPPLAGAPDDPKNYVDVFPFELKEEDVRRGMERYTIFCTPCHSPAGDGNGKIVERGYLRPTAYYQLRDEHGKILEGTGVARGFERFRVLGDDKKPIMLHDVPVGYYFEVISKGFGGMPDYAAQIPPEDRWRIAAYIRTLQLSQGAKLADLPEKVQKIAKESVGKKQP